MAITPGGNVVVAGSITGTADVGCGPASTTSTTGSVWVAVLSPAGQCLWSRVLGGAGSQAGGIAVDGQGNVAVGGSFTGSVDLGCGALTSAGAEDAFLGEWDSAGNCRWSKRFGDAASQQGVAVKTEASGDVVFLGNFAGSMDLGGGPLTSAGGTDVFLSCFSPSGTLMWGQRFGDSAAQAGHDVAVAGNGDVFITGSFNGTLNLGGGALTSAGGSDVFAARFDSGGNPLWSKRFGSAGAEQGLGIALDGQANVTVCGDFSTSVDFGGGPLTSAGGRDAFVVRLSAAGQFLWSTAAGDAGNQSATAVASDGAGNVTVTGTMAGSVNWGGGALTAAGSTDVFLAQFDASGAHVWSSVLGDAAAQSASALALFSDGTTLVTGSFQGSMSLPGGLLTSAGGLDGFVAHVVP